MVEASHPHLSIVRQCALLQISRSGRYYHPVRIPMHPAQSYRFEAAHRSEVMAPTVLISSRPPF